jgi:hypothetical protein
MGKLLIIAGIFCILLGLFITYSHKFPFPGRLPGDIVIEKGNFRIYFPIITSIVVSILISVLFYFYHRFKS